MAERKVNVDGTDVYLKKSPLLPRLIIILIASIILFVIGMMIGYGILHSPFGIFDPKTWMHLKEMTGSD